MNTLNVKWRAAGVLFIAFFLVFLQVIGLFPGLTLITQSFPTYHHREEAAVIVVLLIGALLTLAFGSKRLRHWAAIGIGSLVLFGGLGLVRNILLDTPPQVKLFWASGNAVTVALLGWLLLGALKSGIVVWRDLWASLAIFCVATAYLLVVPRLN